MESNYWEFRKQSQRRYSQGRKRLLQYYSFLLFWIMAERNMKRGPKVPDKAKPVDKRRRSVSITNEMMRERQVCIFFIQIYFTKVS